MLSVSIICPVYNGAKYLKNLFKKIHQQHYIDNLEIIIPVSPSKDNSYEEAKIYGDIVYLVSNFNHGITRHEAALKAQYSYLIFITQDIMPVDNFWLYNLIKNLDNNIVASFSRQIAYKKHGEIERLIRNFNYPTQKRICNAQNASLNGRKNIFYSDASSAILKSIFFELGGYNFKVPTSEDNILANNIIKNNKTFIYEPESIIYHSHKLSIKNNYKRYKSIGKFEKLYSNKINFEDTNSEGKKLVIYVAKNLIKEGKIIVLICFFIDVLIRLIGYKRGYYE